MLVGSNGLNLNVDAEGEGSNLDQGSGRGMGVEKLLVDLVDLAKVTNVSDKDVDLDNALPGGAGSSNDVLDVGKNLAGLDLDILVALNELALGGKRNLTGKVEEAIGLDSLGVRADGSGSVFGEDLIND